MIVVAKMYVASVILNGNADQENVHRVVNLNTVYSPNPITENYSFWKASPSGTLRLSFPSSVEMPEWFKPGQSFKVYHSQKEGGGWFLSQAILDEARLNINLSKANTNEWWRFVNGREEMSIDNQDVFPFYMEKSGVEYSLLFVPVDKEGKALDEGFEL